MAEILSNTSSGHVNGFQARCNAKKRRAEDQAGPDRHRQCPDSAHATPIDGHQHFLPFSPIRNKLSPPRPSSGTVGSPLSLAHTIGLRSTPSSPRSPAAAPDYSSLPAASSATFISPSQPPAPNQAGFIAHALPVEAARTTRPRLPGPVIALSIDLTSTISPAQSFSTTPTLDYNFYANLPSPPNLAPLEDYAWNNDPHFGEKVCAQHEQNLRLERQGQNLREQKYGSSVALAFPRGRTPQEARTAYEMAQEELMRQFEEAQSDSDDE